jgi:hypothetical protein
MTTGEPEPVRIFISYAPQDSRFREELEKHLSPLGRAGLVALWSAHAILSELRRRGLLR